MARLKYNLNPISNGEVQIIAVIRSAGETKKKYTGFTIPGNKIAGKFKYWHYEDQRVRGVPNTAEINSKLNNWQQKFNDYLLECKRTDTRFEIFEFLKLLGSEAPVHVITLVQAFQALAASQLLTHSPNTTERYDVLKGQIESFEKDHFKIKLKDVNGDFYDTFCKWLISKHDNSNVTMQRKITAIKTVMRFAKKKRWIDNNDFADSFSLKQVESNRHPLTAEEIEILKNYKTLNLSWRAVIDQFLFACQTGLRYSDMKQLNTAHLKVVQIAGETIQYIDFLNEKKAKRNTIALNSYALDILAKYLPENGLIFRMFADQPTNRYLKDIFKAAKLNRKIEKKTSQGGKVISEILPLHEVISFHTARHTCATNQVLQGLPLKFIQDNLGHGSIKTTMNYTRNSDFDRIAATAKAIK